MNRETFPDLISASCLIKLELSEELEREADM